MSKITYCQRCGAKLENGYFQRFKDVKGKVKLVETICFLCDGSERWQDYANTGVLTTRIFMDLILIDNPKCRHTFHDPICVASAREAQKLIDQKVDEFNDTVWFGDPPLQPVVKKCRTHGMKYEPAGSNITFMAYDMCGRAMMTIENNVASITVITATDEDHNCMGLQGLSATKDQALELLDWAISHHQEITAGLKSDAKVGLF